MDFGLRGKRALVCGGSSGLGKAAAHALADEGVELFLCARDMGKLEAAAAGLRQAHDQPIHTFGCDLTRQAERQRLIEAIQRQWGGVDILIHNVGGPPASSVLDTRPEDWQQGFERLFLSVIHLNQALLPGMLKRQWGRIVIITSIAVMEPIPALPVSNAIRSAVTAYAKTLSDAVAANGVTVNCVAPGLIATDALERLAGNANAQRGISREDWFAEQAAQIPSGTLGEPMHVGSAIAFLCSQQAGYITGSTLCVDGGKRRATL